MVESAGKRALRTMDLIPYVLENPGCSISSLAKIFSTSESQIEKDLQLIFMCGLPGYTPYELIDIVFENGVVTVIDPQVLNKPRRFSKKELIVITIGLRILSELFSANLPHKLKIEELIKKISSLVPIYSFSDNLKNDYLHILAKVNRAINSGLEMEIEYTSLSKDETKARKIIPTEIYMLNGNIFLRAYDLDLSAERIFRLDLIKIINEGKSVRLPTIDSSENEYQVLLQVSKARRLFLERNSSVITRTKEVGNSIEVNLKVSNLLWLKRCILSNAPHIRVLSPIEIGSKIKAEARAILALYDQKEI